MTKPSDLSRAALRRPPFDPELHAALTVLADSIPPSITSDMIDDVRARQVLTVTDETLSEAGIEAQDITFIGHGGDEVSASILRPKERTGTGPGIYYIHERRHSSLGYRTPVEYARSCTHTFEETDSHTERT